ncbi:MAG TPA: hypothetical protein VF398_01120 [bacterium]|jgi:hypothetical protein
MGDLVCKADLMTDLPFLLSISISIRLQNSGDFIKLRPLEKQFGLMPANALQNPLAAGIPKSK